MFMGQFEHTIDTKGRVIVPVKYREELGDNFVVTWGLDGCLFLYPMKEWTEFADKLQNLPSSKNARMLQRQFLSKAMEVTLDKQGRILVPARLRTDARLEKDVVFIGMMNRVEIWDKATFEGMENEESALDMADAMDEMGISL